MVLAKKRWRRLGGGGVPGAGGEVGHKDNGCVGGRQRPGQIRSTSFWRMDLEVTVVAFLVFSGYFFQDHLERDIGGWI
jgi:hypothetical protein